MNMYSKRVQNFLIEHTTTINAATDVIHKERRIINELQDLTYLDDVYIDARTGAELTNNELKQIFPDGIKRVKWENTNRFSEWEEQEIPTLEQCEEIFYQAKKSQEQQENTKNQNSQQNNNQNQNSQHRDLSQHTTLDQKQTPSSSQKQPTKEDVKKDGILLLLRNHTLTYFDNQDMIDKNSRKYPLYQYKDNLCHNNDNNLDIVAYKDCHTQIEAAGHVFLQKDASWDWKRKKDLHMTIAEAKAIIEALPEYREKNVIIE